MYKITSRNAQLRAGRINWEEIASSQHEDLARSAHLLAHIDDVDEAEYRDAIDAAQGECALWQHRMSMAEGSRSNHQAAFSRAAQLRKELSKALRIKFSNIKELRKFGAFVRPCRREFGDVAITALLIQAEEDSERPVEFGKHGHPVGSSRTDFAA